MQRRGTPATAMAPTLALLILALAAAHLSLSYGQCADPNATLAAHNKHRAKHGSAALKWNYTLASAAVNHARKLAAQGCKLSPYVTSVWGQNLAAFFGYPKAQCVAATDLWYSQVKNYAFTKTPFTDNVLAGKQVGSFTQVVWAGSKELGCGAAVNATENCFAAICFYSPFGNIQGNYYYLQNVKPPVNATARPPPPSPKRSPPPSPVRRPPYPPGTKLPPSPPPKPNSTTKAPPPPLGCKDVFSFCADWKAKGYCAQGWSFDNQPVATVWCKKTCGKC